MTPQDDNRAECLSERALIIGGVAGLAIYAIAWVLVGAWLVAAMFGAGILIVAGAVRGIDDASSPDDGGEP